MMRRVVSDGLRYVANRIVASFPSHFVRLLFYRHVMGFEIGVRSNIFMDAWFEQRQAFKMGCNSVINEKCKLDNRGGITIGNNVSISAQVCILTADHDMGKSDFASRQRPVCVEDDVFIGTRAMILPGVTLGRGSAVAAGAVVTKSVEPYTVVAGVPAKPVAQRPTHLEYDSHYPRLFC